MGNQIEGEKMFAKVVINTEKEIGKVNRRIYGSLIENLGKCIYGGVYDPDSPSADEDGFRQDVICAAKKMGVSSVRFPGGCYAPYYHFEDGIGSKDERPKTRYRINYDNPDNSFGTDEYIKWCEKIGAEPFICVNMGTGTAEEARNWVEYCNGKGGSRWADKRIENGHSEPYHVKLWGLGNEVGGKWELGYFDNAEDYVKKARAFAMCMKEADPEIELVGCGSHFPIIDGNYEVPLGNYPEPSDNWNREVLDRMFDYLDYINMHDYIGHDYKDGIMSEWESMEPDKIHYYLCEYMELLEDAYDIMRGDIKLICHKHNRFKKIAIALDEYNPWYRSDENTSCNYSVADGLLTGAYFNIFIRNADVAVLSNMAQLVNVLPAIVVDSGKSGYYRTAVSYVQELYIANAGHTAVDCWVKSSVWKGCYYEEVPYIDASASFDVLTGTVVLNIVNRHLSNEIICDLNILGYVIKEITGCFFGNEKIDLENSFQNPDLLKIKQYKWNGTKQIIANPLSVNVLKIKLDVHV